MTQNNILLISGAILPVIITVIIGYISGKRKDFNWQQAGDINKIVMLYALPLSIFSNMVMTPRHIVMTMGPVAVAIILALILSFVIPLLVARYLFRRDLALSTLQALAIGSPAVPFIGTSVLAFLFGTASASLITGDEVSATHCSITFTSWRTLPGHLAAISRFIASLENARTNGLWRSAD